MNFIEMLKMRRSVYNLNKKLPVFDDRVLEIINGAVQYAPDAFNMKSQRLVVIRGEKNDDFWNEVYDVLSAVTGGHFSREKIDSFMAGYGTILYFYDRDVVDEYKKNFSLYADNFNGWALQANAMLQFAIWTGFTSIGIGASLQHYNPVIDDMVHKMFGVPENWVLVAQMPFGGIAGAPSPKLYDNITERVKFIE